MFRKLTNTVDVHYTYRGGRGSITVAARLSNSSGWHSTLPLTTVPATSPTDQSGVLTQGKVRLDLKALDFRGQLGAATTGIPATQLVVTIVATVRTPAAADFVATLPLTLTPLQLTPVAASAKNLTVTDSATLTHPGRVSRTVTVAGQTITASTARLASAILLLIALLAATAAAVALRVRRSVRMDPGTAVAVKYAARMVAVGPDVELSAGRIVSVESMDALAKLAERYERLILHLFRDGRHSFLVEDDGCLYRYSAEVPALPRPGDPPNGYGPAAGRPSAVNSKTPPSWPAPIGVVPPVRPQPRQGDRSQDMDPQASTGR